MIENRKGLPFVKLLGFGVGVLPAGSDAGGVLPGVGMLSNKTYSVRAKEGRRITAS
ncbi:MAG: hypothetical protein LUD27_08750 [Clostridia bacterium]|nr:hypothetical protein [Clostridia bacterium]